MKFSWKICFATIMISLTILSAGGYVLISALFQSTFEREVENALEENQMLQYSFVAYWNTTVQESKVTKENVQKAGKALLQNMKGSRIRMLDKGQYVLLDNTEAEKDTSLLEQVNETTRGYLLRQTVSGYEIQTASVISIDENKGLYLESIRDVTKIFEERDRQYGIYRLWMLGILVLESICCFGMAVWMLRPLKHLSETTGKIAEGQLSVRANVTTQDEFGELADSFNVMADSLERQVQELEMSAKRQEDFIGSFAHELKTPLTSMIGYADMLRSREMSEEERFQAANYI
ncbi:MAG: HAMP domain-containing protein, partial [Lachnospiraceae bacterium]|nr:HAMP domain-containing protein [Lachnospiraceae bacterium]